MLFRSRKVGDVFSVPLTDGRYAFGRVLEDPLMAFYDFKADEQVAAEQIISYPVAFRVWVTRDAITSGRWEVLGNFPLEPHMLEEVWFSKQDIISKQLSLYKGGHDWEEIPATFDQCKDLELAQVWGSSHLEDRLNDHFAGRKNIWVESSKVKQY